MKMKKADYKTRVPLNCMDAGSDPSSGFEITKTKNIVIRVELMEAYCILLALSTTDPASPPYECCNCSSAKSHLSFIS